MEHGDPVRFLEDGFEVRVRVDLGGEAVPVLQEGPDHVRFHRARAEQGDVDDEVVELPGRHLADQLPLARGFDLEAAQGVGAADQLIGGFVVERDGVEVDAAVLGDVVRACPVRACRVGAGGHHLGFGGVEPDDFPDGEGHGALHPDAQDIEFEHAHGVHVVFVELAHGQAQSAGLHGRAVQQGGIAQDDPAGVHGDMAGQPVQPFCEVHQQVQLLVFAEVALLHPAGEFLQLGLLHEGFAEVPGRETPQLLGDVTDLAVVHAQGQAGVAHGTASAVAVLHAHQRDAFGAEALKDLPVDVVPFGAFDVDVDVRQGGAVPGEEAFEDEVVLQRVHLADVDQVVDQAGGARTAGGRPDPHVQDHPGNLGDGQEVGGEAQAVDDPQFVLQPRAQFLGGFAGDPREPPADAGLAALGQLGERVAGDADYGGFRDHGLLPAHVGHRIHPAAVRERLGLGHQLLEVRRAVPGGVDDFLAELEHLRGRFEPALPVGLQQRGGGELGEGFQGPGGVQHIRGGRTVLGHIPHGVAQHGGHPVFRGEFEHPHRMGGAQRLPGRAELGDHLGGEGPGRHGVEPAFEKGAGPQVAPAAHGTSDVGVRADQHRQDRLAGFPGAGCGRPVRPG